MCRCKTKSIVFHRKKNHGADVSVPVTTSGMAVSGGACRRPPPGFSENPCLSHATCSACPNVRNIPSTAAANIPMHGNISSSCPGDRSDNVMTNSTAHFPMGVSHENAFTPLPVPGNAMTRICNCNFDMNMSLKNVEDSVLRILTEKERVYYQRLEEVENGLSNLATSGPISSASDHFLSVRSRMLVASHQSEAEMISCLSVLSKDSGVDEASKTSESGFKHIKAYVGNEYAAK
jgi:hypothetical protein